MKAIYYYRGHTGSAGFLLPEDMALLKRLFAHGSLPPKAQLQETLLAVSPGEHEQSGNERDRHQRTGHLPASICGRKRHADRRRIQNYMCGWDLQRPSLRFLTQQAAEKKMDYILSCSRNRIYRGHDLRGLLQYEDHMHALGVDILYPFEQD